VLRHEQKTFPGFIKARERPSRGTKKTQGGEKTKNNTGGQGASTEREGGRRKKENQRTNKQIQREEGPEKNREKKTAKADRQRERESILRVRAEESRR